MIKRFRLRVIACLLIVIMALPLAESPVEVQAESLTGAQESQDRAVDYVNGYLMADYKYHDGYEKVFFRYSEDGLTWRDLNKADGTALPILTNDAEGGDFGVLDPFLIRSAQGDRYWMLGTDRHVENSSDWDPYNGSPNMVIWESRDLVNWSEPYLVSAGFDDVGRIWTPRAIYDDVMGDYVVYWIAKDRSLSGTDNEVFRAYVCRTKDFHTFSEPHEWIQGDSVSGSLSNVEYVSIVQDDDGKFYRFSVMHKSSERYTVVDVSSTLDTEDIQGGEAGETQSSPKGSWKRIMARSEGQAVGFGRFECLMVYKLPNGSWCLLGDDLSQGNSAFGIDNLAECVFTVVPTSFESRFLCGSVMQLTAEENARVKEAFDKTQPDNPPDETSDFTYKVLDDNTLKITDYNGTETDITVPSVIDGKQVTGIGTWAFGSKITSVTLPDSISSIDSWAFHEGENITSINISSGNKNYSSYDGCLYTKDGSRLLYCPCGKNSANLRNGLKTIASYAFYGCNNIKNLVLPEGLTKLDAYAFGNFTSLRSISIPKGVTEIGIEAFWYCSSLERIEIPDSVTRIGYGVFSDCRSLESIDIDKNNQNYLMENGLLLNKEKTNLLCCPAKRSGNIIIPDSVTEISEGAFSSCMDLTGIEIPNSVKSIGSDAFSGCRGLVGIDIPDSVTNIGYSAFKNCSSLAKIVIPSSITDIESDMFSGCISLASIEIPDCVTNIEGAAFSNCSSLRDVYYTGSSSQWEEISIGRDNKNLTNATIHYNFQHVPSEIVPVSISLSDQTVSLTAGGRKQLTYTLFPSAATAAVTYTSSNPSVATVGRTSGLVTAVGNGTAVITVSTDGGLQASCTVVVHTPSDNRPTKITLGSKALTLKKGSSKKLTYTLEPSNASSTVTFTTSNPSVATVDRNGTVTAKKKGTATITAKASGLTASCKVTVTETVKLKTPSLTVKLNSANGVKLSWKKVSGAQGYYVYRATSKNGSYKQIKKLKGTSYVNNKLKSGKTYYYKVVAYKGSTLSAKSKVKSKKVSGKPATPKMTISVDNKAQIFTVSWGKVKNATKIEIICENENGVFKKWKTVPAKKKKASYAYPKHGTKYRFALRAYYVMDGKKIYSGNSKPYTLSF